jgi:hypothetical protein
VLDTPGAGSMTILKHYFASGDWPRLRPAQDLLIDQPGDDDARHFVAVARTEGGEWTTSYLPVGGAIRLSPGAAEGASARWFDPRHGHWLPAASADADGALAFVAPSADDWVLDLRRFGAGMGGA